MYSKKDSRIAILRNRVEQHPDALADILLTYVENPGRYPLMENLGLTPEEIFDNAPESRKELSRLLFDAKFNVSEESLQIFISSLNKYADELDKIEEDRQTKEMYNTIHGVAPQPSLAG